MRKLQVTLGIAIYLALILLFKHLTGPSPHSGPGPSHGHRSVLTRISYALILYTSNHGNLPYSEKGEEYALYALRKDFGPKDLQWEKGKFLTFDDQRGVLSPCPFRYLNRPGSSLTKVGPDTVILTADDESGGSLYATPDGVVVGTNEARIEVGQRRPERRDPSTCPGALVD
jgi:hypothetical protein